MTDERIDSYVARGKDKELKKIEKNFKKFLKAKIAEIKNHPDFETYNTIRVFNAEYAGYQRTGQFENALDEIG